MNPILSGKQTFPPLPDTGWVGKNGWDQFTGVGLNYQIVYNSIFIATSANGGLAQMVERALCMREVAGSMPASSKSFLLSFFFKFKHNHVLRHTPHI